MALERARSQLGRNKEMFVLESKRQLKLPTCSTSVNVYVMEKSDFRMVFVDVPGPLVSCSIVIPTVSENHKGLPHTLEHLIFCGSENSHSRGFLDTLAVRMVCFGLMYADLYIHSFQPEPMPILQMITLATSLLRLVFHVD